MIPIPGGTFEMGSPASEASHRADEGPVRTVTVSPFWMGELEVSWREYMAFYAATSTGAKTAGETQAQAENASVDPDAITGPTPPYGAPDQGWGKGIRPAITMSHHAAEVYCQWLSRVTGKKYRLPTEAEWEYACRAGKTGPYYFEGDPAKFTRTSWKNRLFGTDDSAVRKYAWFQSNGGGKTQPPYTVEPNPWGLHNMIGNVREFCSDWYAPDAYSTGPGGEVPDPEGPQTGTEHVIRGGSVLSDPSSLRSAARDHTLTDRWLLTDPQSPKSIWWYSDVKDVGFRVVREAEDPS
ncbi:MAG: formylglycine-generating enzyme family protein [Candidatus Latescibacterota bacterium]